MKQEGRPLPPCSIFAQPEASRGRRQPPLSKSSVIAPAPQFFSKAPAAASSYGPATARDARGDAATKTVRARISWQTSN